MKFISSVNNHIIKNVKKLHTKKYRALDASFLVEGTRLVEEAFSAECLKTVFFDESLLKVTRGKKLYEKLMQSPIEQESIFQVTPDIIKLLAETESPQGIVAVARKATLLLANFQAEKGIVLISDGIQDPGNLGTMIRTAWAAGVKAVICLQGTVDPFNDKTVRSTMGGIFYIPVITGECWPNVYAWCCDNDYQIVAGDLQGEHYCHDIYRENVALVIGNEGQGLMSVTSEDIDKRVKIPLIEGAESLNASVACGILLYEILRQKKC